MSEDIEKAYKRLGQAIVQNACEEWIENARLILKFETKAKLHGLTKHQEQLLIGAIGRNIALERFIMSDWGETLSGLDGKVIVEKLNERASKW